jgi:hypothetical protein
VSDFMLDMASQKMRLSKSRWLAYKAGDEPADLGGKRKLPLMGKRAFFASHLTEASEIAFEMELVEETESEYVLRVSRVLQRGCA